MSTLIPSRSDRLKDVLLGTAVGDALGLPTEGLSAERIRKRWDGVWKHRLVFGKGLVSDDTEHTLFVAQALLSYPQDANLFQQSLAWKLKLWLLGIPAGIGFATLRAICKLWLRFKPNSSGVFSAGNGPAMRSAIIGVFFADDISARRRFVSASTRITHSDPEAETGALAVAECAATFCGNQFALESMPDLLSSISKDSEWQSIIVLLSDELRRGASVEEFHRSIGGKSGVSGYVYQTAPVAIYSVLRHPGSFRKALKSVLNCGGDTDTVGAIVGALMGAKLGCSAIPEQWQSGLIEWPRSIRVLSLVGERLAKLDSNRTGTAPVQYFWPALILRNILFVIVVLMHALRRVLPPF